jgi:F-box and leucine-rich repeat protein GRR1
MSQRAAFCVYSGKGVSELRMFLTDLFAQITEELHSTDDSTEYDDDDGYALEDIPDADDMETGNEGDDDEDYVRNNNRPSSPQYNHPNLSMFRGRRQTIPGANGSGNGPQIREVVISRDQRTFTIPPPTPDRGMNPPPVPPIRTNGHAPAVPAPSRRTPRSGGFGHQPIIETSISPPPSDVASSRSAGTNSNGAGFFRTYQEAAVASSTRSNGALTPDLDFAEIGHGRGTGQRSTDVVMAGPSSSGLSQAVHSSSGLQNGHHGHGRMEVLADSSNSYRPIAWPHIHRESTPSPSSSTRELHDSVQSALGHGHGQGRDTEVRGRSVKRSLRNTFHVAEHLASSFLFGRPSGSSGAPHDEGGGNGMIEGSGRH